jgi:hypothetical protein
MMIPAGRESHWRDGERLIRWVEELCSTPKVWGFLKALAPSSRYVEAWEGQVHIVTQNQRLRRREPLWLRGHREESGVKIITLAAEGGRQVLRRGHVDGGHQEPDGGPFISGPHIHFPTSVFGEIGNRGRSRVYPWSIDHRVPLKDAMLCFASHIAVVGVPDGQAPLDEEN